MKAYAKASRRHVECERKAYLCLDVVKGWWRNDGEADEEDISLWVGEWAKTVVILLSGGIPKSERDWLAINHHAGRVVVEAGYC